MPAPTDINSIITTEPCGKHCLPVCIENQPINISYVQTRVHTFDTTGDGQARKGKRIRIPSNLDYATVRVNKIISKPIDGAAGEPDAYLLRVGQAIMFNGNWREDVYHPWATGGSENSEIFLCAGESIIFWVTAKRNVRARIQVAFYGYKGCMLLEEEHFDGEDDGV